mmetsp:Transcript_10906/g.44638  ORF Transcript_10906/g.44638 Transcript_10906/m.44638 type:complete len:283 (+) Transcript_10906:177-1025(+)
MRLFRGPAAESDVLWQGEQPRPVLHSPPAHLDGLSRGKPPRPLVPCGGVLHAPALPRHRLAAHGRATAPLSVRLCRCLCGGQPGHLPTLGAGQHQGLLRVGVWRCSRRRHDARAVLAEGRQRRAEAAAPSHQQPAARHVLAQHGDSAHRAGEPLEGRRGGPLLVADLLRRTVLLQRVALVQPPLRQERHGGGAVVPGEHAARRTRGHLHHHLQPAHATLRCAGGTADHVQLLGLDLEPWNAELRRPQCGHDQHAGGLQRRPRTAAELQCHAHRHRSLPPKRL